MEQLRSVFDRPGVGYSAEYGLHEGGLAASVGTDHAEEIIGADLQIDLFERFVIVIGDAYVMHADQIHRMSVIKSVIESMLAITSSRRGSISTGRASMSRAIVSTTDTGNCF